MINYWKAIVENHQQMTLFSPCASLKSSLVVVLFAGARFELSAAATAAHSKCSCALRKKFRCMHLSAVRISTNGHLNGIHCTLACEPQADPARSSSIDPFIKLPAPI